MVGGPLESQERHSSKGTCGSLFPKYSPICPIQPVYSRYIVVQIYGTPPRVPTFFARHLGAKKFWLSGKTKKLRTEYCRWVMKGSSCGDVGRHDSVGIGVCFYLEKGNIENTSPIIQDVFFSVSKTHL